MLESLLSVLTGDTNAVLALSGMSGFVIGAFGKRIVIGVVILISLISSVISIGTFIASHPRLTTALAVTLAIAFSTMSVGCSSLSSTQSRVDLERLNSQSSKGAFLFPSFGGSLHCGELLFELKESRTNLRKAYGKYAEASSAYSTCSDDASSRLILINPYNGYRTNHESKN